MSAPVVAHPVGMEHNRDGRLVLGSGVSVAPGALRFQATASGGPGGQHVNTTNSAVILHCPLYALVGLDGAARARLRVLAGSRLNTADELVLRCDSHRAQHQNKDELLQRLAALVVQAQRVPKKRRPTKPGRGAIERRLQAKKERSWHKRRRGDIDPE